jgi:hypothetical protein
VTWRTYQSQLGEPRRVTNLDEYRTRRAETDECAAEWVAAAVAEHNRKARRRQQAIDFAIGIVAGAGAAWGLASLSKW